ncbi:MAG TPA: hypothetical protein PLL58_06245 [Candidatus Syntrophosphaera sp.]|nr:hypothetical protein [Candidatus Syntrophosphaera sp.]
MTITRTQVEKILLKRAARRMAFVEMDIAKSDGTNADLNDPIAYAVRLCGLSVADISDVKDSDLAPLPDSDIDKLLDLAELRLLQNIFGNLDSVDERTGPVQNAYSQFGTQLETALKRLEEKCQRNYGVGQGTISVGYITLDFQQKEADDDV